MSPSSQHVRHVLTRKRAVVRDSVSVVRYSGRALAHSRFLLRLVVGFVLVVVPALVAWRAFGPKPTNAGERSLAHSAIVGARFLGVMSLQYLVAVWLYAKWCGNAHQHVRRLFGRLSHRLPGFVVCAAFLAWCDRAASLSSGTSIVRGLVAFGFTYVLSYAVPAEAVYDTGLVRAFHRTYRALRSTFGADMLAWSGVWIINGAMALLAAIPDALDIYSPRAAGVRVSLVGRLVNWLVLMPAGISAQALAAAFCTVIFFALAQNRAPAGFPKSAVETVSGLQLED